MGTYEPKAQCRGGFTEPVDCQPILEDMPATKDMVVFGPEGGANVEEILPTMILTGKLLVLYVR